MADDGTRSRGRGGSTLWVFWNKSALRADLRVFQSMGCWALGCVVPRGPQKHPSAGPWGASYRRGSQRMIGHTSARDTGLTWWTTGPARVGGAARRYGFFWNKSVLRADLRVFQSVGCRALGCVVPRGPQTHTSAGPWGASYRRGVNEDPRTRLPNWRGLDLVDDGTRSRGRGRLDVMGFFEQVRTSCGPQSLSKRRMPILGVCGSSGASTTHLSWPLRSIVPSGGQKGPSDAFPQGAWA